MIYREFLMFVLAPLLVVVAILFVRSGKRLSRVVPIGLLAVLALVYTTPWDGWLIRNGVWSYPQGSVLGTIADVPLEEYCFMVGQTVLTGLWTLTVTTGPPAPGGFGRRRPLHAIAWLVVALIGIIAMQRVDATYLGSMAVWFGPPLALQAAFGADVLRAARPQRLAALSITGVLWVADAVAIHSGAWQISTTHTSGFNVLGLPVEEAVFFLVTNLLIVNSLILLSSPAVRARVGIRRRREEPSWEYARSAGRPTG